MPIHPNDITEKNIGKKVIHHPLGRKDGQPYCEGKLIGRYKNKVVVELALKMGGKTKVLLDPWTCTLVEPKKFVGKNFSDSS